jgi:hypothetical protein
VEKTERSVADALKQVHGALLADLRALEQALQPSSGEGVAALRTRLGATHAHITEHFRCEEQNGYMDAVMKREPRLERTVQQLAQEHGQLRQSLDALIGQSRAVASLSDSMRGAIQDWIEEVRRHEQRENDLVQNAFNLDIGAED